MNDADAHGEIGRRSGALIAWIDPILAARGTTLDHAQVAALERLQQLATELEAFRAARQSTLKKIFAPPDVPRGVYLWGGVGRGKSFLMDAFFATVAIKRKTRIHFHAFMRDVHEDLARLKDEEDPLATVAAHIARKWRLVCFDEFHVSEIADAMILGRLLSALFERGVVFVMTSNYAPDDLYPNGLQRERFLPAIELIKSRLDVLEVDNGTDYRRLKMERLKVYHVGTDSEFPKIFDALKDVEEERHPLDVEGRPIPYRKRAGGLVWFDFQVLCGGPRSYADYVDLAHRFHTIMLSGVPRMSPKNADAARRFTWLIDVLYDDRVNLIVSAEAEPDQLFTEGANSAEFQRSASRLLEMQSVQYLQAERRARIPQLQ